MLKQVQHDENWGEFATDIPRNPDRPPPNQIVIPYHQPRHPGAGRDLTLSPCRTGEIPAFAGMTDMGGGASLRPVEANPHRLTFVIPAKAGTQSVRRLTPPRVPPSRE